MGEELLCNGGNWWINPERSSLSCSSIATEFSEAKTHQSCDESAGSACGSSITFQETPPSSSMSWTQVLLSGGGADQTLNYMFQDQELGSRTGDQNYVESSNPFGGMAKSFLLDSELSSLGCMQQPPWPSFSQLLSSSVSSSNQRQPNYRPSLQFTNNTPWWNPSASSFVTTDHPTKHVLSCPSTPSKSAIFQSLEQPKTSPPVIRKSPSSSSKKTASEAPATKRPRAADAPSPQPTFKVRKEKLGDRITALQQLVSPFGKTDTASVLQEAIDYIKFLHEQVSALSSPYLKEGRPMKQRQMFEPTNDCGETKPELRSRGLCLVPITGNYPAASDQTTADLGYPTFGGASFRKGELSSCCSLDSEE